MWFVSGSKLIMRHFLFSSFSLRDCDQLVLEKCDALLEKLPQPMAVATFDGNSSPYWVILNQEVNGWNWRLQAVVTSLTTTVLAVKGQAVMTEVQRDVYTALASEKVPKCWQVGPCPYISDTCIPFFSLFLGIGNSL